MWLKFESDSLLFQDSSGMCTPSPFKQGRPLHILSDEHRIKEGLEHIYKQQAGVNEVSWTRKEEEMLLDRLYKSESCWGCQFNSGDVIDLGCVNDESKNDAVDAVDEEDEQQQQQQQQQQEEEEDSNMNSSGIKLTKRWTMSCWCRGGDWVTNGRATLCQSTNGDKMICLDEMGRLGTLKAATGMAYEDMFARWYCVRYPPEDRPEYVAVYVDDDDDEEHNEIKNNFDTMSNSDDSDDSDDSDEDADVFLSSTKKKRKNKKLYADALPHLLDDPNHWFHLVVIANPVPTTSKKGKGTYQN